MLNEKQKEIADYLLKYLEQKGGKSSLDDYPSALQEKGYNEFEWTFIIEFMNTQLGLIYYFGNTGYILALTKEGYRAAETGIGKYLKLIEEEKELEKTNLISSIEGLKSSKKLSKIAIMVAIVIPLLSLGINLWIQVGFEKKKIQDENHLGVTKVDSTSIETIKFHLKKDKEFLNDIKNLSDRK